MRRTKTLIASLLFLRLDDRVAKRSACCLGYFLGEDEFSI